MSPAAKKQKTLQRRFRSDIRTLFTNAGFTHVPTRDQEITFEGRVAEIDALFLINNVVVVVEETTHTGANVNDHLRKKAELFDHLEAFSEELVPFLADSFTSVKRHFAKNGLDVRQCVVKYVYCSRYDIDQSYRTRYDRTCSVLQYAALQYFLRLSRTIHKSTRFELFKFLGLDLGHITGPARQEFHSYKALLLPEVPSGFPSGYRLVSFLIDPYTLIERAYVLRADSWRDQQALYQRLLVKGKINSMREYLVSEGRVFVNNIIVTLPTETVFTPAGANFNNNSGKRHRSVANDIASGTLVIPREFNTIGIIDGQHRVFAYHEADDKNDNKIAQLRGRQHLLVTGIIYPKAISRSDAQVFEAQLFLEINDKQKRVRGDLKQSIERIVNPYSAVAVAKAVIERMAATGPLNGLLEVHFFDVGKIKTASVVSYGLRHIVDIHGDNSLFKLWRGRNKTGVKKGANEAALTEYVHFAASQLNMFVSGFKAVVNDDLWTTDRKASRALSATTINGLVFCMRRLIERRKVASFDEYKIAFAKMNIDFRAGYFPFKSSHWRELGDTLFKQCFTD